jgi:5-(carboxyamino)imidazole ribonucleotide synthase
MTDRWPHISLRLATGWLSQVGSVVPIALGTPCPPVGRRWISGVCSPPDTLQTVPTPSPSAPVPGLTAGLPLSVRDHLPEGFPVVGVIGGGQLARMMQPPAIELGIRLRVLAESDDASAAQVVPDSPVGDYRDPATVSGFAAGCDVVTFDHEHVPGPLLEKLVADGETVRPGPAALQFAQDKLAMRSRLTGLGLPCPRWRQVFDWDDVLAFGAELADSPPSLSGGPAVVLKTPRGGYDGKGVLVVDLANGDAETARRWLTAAGETGLVAEERVSFSRELAVLVARSPSGQAAAWPVVESTQVDGVCREVVAPAPDLNPELAARATEIALTIAGQLGVVGVLAVEMFEVTGPEGSSVLVNELAMRPHNSGHWTIDGAVTSQFEQHLRAVLDLPLGDPRPRSRWSVMVNVLGGDHPDLYRSYLHVMARDPGVKVHMYGKDVRQGRKVGHVTVCGDDLADCRLRARHAADFIRGVIDE